MTRPSYDPDWRQRYAHKLRSADDALKVVRVVRHARRQLVRLATRVWEALVLPGRRKLAAPAWPPP